MLGLKPPPPPPLWLEIIEGLTNGLPLKLLLIGLLVSEFLELGLVGLLGIGDRESNFLLAAMDSLAKVLITGKSWLISWIECQKVICLMLWIWFEREKEFVEREGRMMATASFGNNSGDLNIVGGCWPLENGIWIVRAKTKKAEPLDFSGIVIFIAWICSR